jgi:hypothetical protein
VAGAAYGNCPDVIAHCFCDFVGSGRRDDPSDGNWIQLAYIINDRRRRREFARFPHYLPGRKRKYDEQRGGYQGKNTTNRFCQVSNIMHKVTMGIVIRIKSYSHQILACFFDSYDPARISTTIS